MNFKGKPKGGDRASLGKFHKEFLDFVCEDSRIRELIADFCLESLTKEKVYVFKEPLFAIDGVFLQGERYRGRDEISPDILIVYPSKDWHMLFVELKSCPKKGKTPCLIGDTKTEFHLLYDYMLKYSEHIYSFFEHYVISGEKDKIPRDVIESCNIDFLGIYRRKKGLIDKILSCKLPTLPELIERYKNHEKYPLVFEHA